MTTHNIPAAEKHALNVAASINFLDCIRAILYLRDYNYHPIPRREYCIEDQEINQFEPLLLPMFEFV